MRPSYQAAVLLALAAGAALPPAAVSASPAAAAAPVHAIPITVTSGDQPTTGTFRKIGQFRWYKVALDKGRTTPSGARALSTPTTAASPPPCTTRRASGSSPSCSRRCRAAVRQGVPRAVRRHLLPEAYRRTFARAALPGHLPRRRGVRLPDGADDEVRAGGGAEADRLLQLLQGRGLAAHRRQGRPALHCAARDRRWPPPPGWSTGMAPPSAGASASASRSRPVSASRRPTPAPTTWTSARGTPSAPPTRSA